jgi:hypothetical protein
MSPTAAYTGNHLKWAEIEDLAQKLTLILSSLPQRELLVARGELRLLASSDSVTQEVLQHQALIEATINAHAAHLRHHSWFHTRKAT